MTDSTNALHSGVTAWRWSSPATSFMLRGAITAGAAYGASAIATGSPRPAG